MKSLLKCIPTYLKDSNDLIRKLQNLPLLPPNAWLFTADAIAMYMNIDTDIALKVFTFLFIHYREEIPSNFPRSFFLKVLEIIMKNNLFQFDNTSAACLYATIAYGVHERNKLLPSYQAFLKLYMRYIDDVIGIWIPSEDRHDALHWSNFKQAMNEWGKLKWIISDRKTSADFLDLLTLTIENGKIITYTFQKSMNHYLYIPPISAHPTSCFKGLIVGNFLRF